MRSRHSVWCQTGFLETWRRARLNSELVLRFFFSFASRIYTAVRQRNSVPQLKRHLFRQAQRLSAATSAARTVGAKLSRFHE